MRCERGAVLAVCLADAACTVFTSVPFAGSSFLIVTFVFSFCLGFIGGVVYYGMSRMLHATRHMGKAMGAGASVALIFQYVFQYRMDHHFLQMVLILCSLAAVTVLSAGRLFDPVIAQDGGDFSGIPFGKDDRDKDRRKGTTKTVWRILTIEVLMEVFFFYFNQSLLAGMAASGMKEQAAYDWPRLCGMIGYLVIGFVGDIKKRRFVPISSLCFIIPGLITPLIAAGGSGQTFAMAVFYVAVMARISYFNLMFWDAAPHTGNPELWAGMGRIVTSVVEIIFVLIGLSSLSAVQMLGIELVTLALIVIVLAVNGDLNLTELTEIPDLDRQAANGENTPGLAERAILQYQEKYDLTGKETEVMKSLISTEENLQELADLMGISRRVLQRYITSIYEKTGTKTRVGLLQSYMDFLTAGDLHR